MRIERADFSFLEVLRRILGLRAKLPTRVDIAITDKCNLDCPMCFRKNFDLCREDMPFDVFKRVAAKFESGTILLPIGQGEPFIHPDIIKIIDYCYKRGFHTKITTNGLLIKPKMVKHLLKLDAITFSIDSLNNKKTDGHNNLKVVKTIEKLVQIKGNKKNPFITIQTVVYKGNKDILGIIKLGKKIDVGRVNLIRPYTKFNKRIGMTDKERAEVYKKADALARQIGIRVDMFEYAMFKGAKRLLYKNFHWLLKLNKRCVRLYDFLYIRPDGKVAPCCLLPDYIVGDILKQDVKETWNSKEFEYFRRNQQEICEGCDALKIG